MRDTLTAAAALAAAAVSFGAVFDTAVPFNYRVMGVDKACSEIRRLREKTGIRRFFLTGPGFNQVMYGKFPDGVYSQIGRDLAEIRGRLADTDVRLSWWCAPSIRYFSDFPSIEDANGNRSKDNKKCPLDPAFAADLARKIASVAAVHPEFICIEDDFTLAWGRGLDGGACFCKRHLADFAKRYGRALTGPEIDAAFKNRTSGNLPVRRAFAETVRGSLVSLAEKIRGEVDKVDPSVRMVLCESGSCSDFDGDAAEAVARALAGGTRPAIRQAGSIYGAETTPASIPGALSHTMWTTERLPKDVEKFYESDPYPHNRFYTSVSQFFSMMAASVAMGTDDFLFYCLQYLDDPLEDPGYADAYVRHRPRLEAVREFIRSRDARLVGLRSVWSSEDLSLTRRHGYGHGEGVLAWNAYLCAKFGFPYTTRKDSRGVSLLIGRAAETFSDEEILSMLKGGLLLDAPAAELLQERGFGQYLGVEVKMADGRLPIIDEVIQPAAGCSRPGVHVNAFYVFFAGTEGTVEKFAELRPRHPTEVWSRFYGVGGVEITPSITLATNSLGGRVAVFATSLLYNRASGLLNLRKQELIRNLLLRLDPETLPVSALGVPGVWLLANESADGREMMLMVNNLSGDVCDAVPLAFSPRWTGAEVYRVAENGSEIPLGRTTEVWNTPMELGQMTPEFLHIVKR
ncbi:MAG: hypothetical protein J6T01_04785 [Kiritimatiellae bacterium]|nr:hypothetical protein [Kiritimatiellia bacterium]